MSSAKETFRSYYNKFFPSPPPKGSIDGEVCDQDILKCFEYDKQSRKYARAKEDITVYKATRDHEQGDDKSYSVTSLTIPKGTRVHLGKNHQKNETNLRDLERAKCRAEKVQVVKADIHEGRRDTTWSYHSVWNGETRTRTPYRNGETVKPSHFYDRETIMYCDEDNCYEEDDVTCEGGIHFFFLQDYAKRYGSYQ